MFRYVKYISTNGNKVGNGVVVGKRLITAAHVVEGADKFSAGSISLITNAHEYYGYNDSWWNRIKNRIFINANMGWKFDDFAIYPFPSNSSPLVLSDSLPKIGERLTSYSIQHHSANSKKGFGNDIFSRSDECLQECEAEAEVIAVRGNFIFCKMTPMLKDGRSGSPLIKEGQVYGILRGGDDKSECWFQSSVSIKKIMNTLSQRIQDSQTERSSRTTLFN